MPDCLFKKKPPLRGGFAVYKRDCLYQNEEVSLEQAHFQIGCGVDQTIVNQHFTIRQAHNQTTIYHAFEMNAVGYFLRRWQYLAGELDFTYA